MESWYEEEDIVGIHIKDKEYWKSVELSKDVIIDISKEGDIIGIEICNARKIFSGDVKKVIDKLLVKSE